MKKIFTREGKLLCEATNWSFSDEELIFTCPGDLPGMEEKNIVIPFGKVLYEDNNRIYVEY